MNAIDDSYWCDSCDHVVELVIPRYKLVVEVVDETGRAIFVLFDREVNKVVGCTTLELLEGFVDVCI